MWIHLEGARDFYVEIVRDIDSGDPRQGASQLRSLRHAPSAMCLGYVQTPSVPRANKVRIEAYFRRDVFDSFTAENFLREIDRVSKSMRDRVTEMKITRTDTNRETRHREGRGEGGCGYAADRSCTAAPDLLFTRTACAFDSAYEYFRRREIETEPTPRIMRLNFHNIFHRAGSIPHRSTRARSRFPGTPRLFLPGET